MNQGPIDYQPSALSTRPRRHMQNSAIFHIFIWSLCKHAQKEFWESAPVSNFLLSVVWVITDGTDISDETQCDSLRLWADFKHFSLLKKLLPTFLDFCRWITYKCLLSLQKIKKSFLKQMQFLMTFLSNNMSMLLFIFWSCNL